MLADARFVSLNPDALDRAAMQLEPDYLLHFAQATASVVQPVQRCNVVVFGSWGGLELDFLANLMAGATIRGFESSEAAARAAVQRVSALNLGAAYEQLLALPTSLPDSRFTHAIAVHPTCKQSALKTLLAEMVRLTVPKGQVIVSLPLRGSFVEFFDLLREFAQKFDLPEVSKAANAASQAKPNPEELHGLLSSLGLTDVDVDVQMLNIPFPIGRQFLEHSLMDLVVVEDATRNLDLDPTLLEQALTYVKEAVSKYWSDGRFDLTVNVGCAWGARSPASSR